MKISEKLEVAYASMRPPTLGEVREVEALEIRIAVLEAQADCRYAHMDGIVCTKCGWASALLGEGK